MKNDIDKNLLDKLKMHIAISNFEDEQNSIKKDTLKNKIDWRIYIMRKKAIIAICLSVILASGIVLANNIETIKKFFGGGLDAGIQTAAQNGYIANPEMDYIKSDTVAESLGTVFDNIPTEVKIGDFMMDDLNLNVEFDFKFDEQIKNVFDLDNLHNIELTDLIVRDEENRILYAGHDKEAFEKYCTNNSLNYTFGEFNENYLNCGLQWYPFFHDKNSNSAKLTYNMYADTYPKSKKLYFSFEKIKLQDESNENIVTLKGNWNIQLDVPENMYNRTTENYKVISCDNDDFDVYASKVSDTGFEIGVIISNITKPERPYPIEEFSRLVDKYNEEYRQTGIISKEAEDFRKKANEWLYKEHPIEISKNPWVEQLGYDDAVSYVENSNGKKFCSTLSASRRAYGKFIDGNKFDFYETFGMTKYDSTDKVKVVLYYYGSPVTIELEKVN